MENLQPLHLRIEVWYFNPFLTGKIMFRENIILEEPNENNSRVKYQLPLKNNNFTGRESFIQTLHTKLEQEKTPILVIFGPKGIGKTQVAKAYAHQYLHIYDNIVWWFNIELNMEDQYKTLALALQLNIHSLKPNEIVKAVQNILRQTPGWLLIFDNAKSWTELLPFLPQQQAERGHILVTSDQRNWPHIETLSIFTADESKSYIQKMIPNTSDEDALTLAADLEFFPLAITQASLFINKHLENISEYLILYKTKKSELFQQSLALLKENSSSEYMDNYRLTIDIAYSITLKKIQEHEKSFHLLKICSFLHADAIPKFLLELISDTCKKPIYFNNIMRPLLAYGLIQRDQIEKQYLIDGKVHVKPSFLNSYSQHRLLQEVLYEKLDQEVRLTYFDMTLEKVQSQFTIKTVELKKWKASIALINHVEAILSKAYDFQIKSKNIYELLANSIDFYFRRDQIPAIEQSLHKLTNYFAEWPGMTIQALHWESNLCVSKRATAKELEVMKNKIKETLNAKNIDQLATYDRTTLELYFSLAAMQSELGEAEEAKAIFLMLLNSSQFNDLNSKQICCANIGNIFLYQKQNLEAINYLKLSLEYNQQNICHPDPNIGYTYNALGKAYFQQYEITKAENDLMSAEENFTHSVNECNKYGDLARLHRYRGWAYFGLVRVLCVKGNLEKAEEFYNQFIKDITKVIPREKWTDGYKECDNILINDINILKESRIQSVFSSVSIYT